MEVGRPSIPHTSGQLVGTDAGDTGDTGDKLRPLWLWTWRHLWRQSPQVSPASDNGLTNLNHKRSYWRMDCCR